MTNPVTLKPDELAQIRPGDEVIIVDRMGNRATAIAQRDHVRDLLWVSIFGTRIDFARKNAAGWHNLAGMRVVGHQPAIDFG